MSVDYQLLPVQPAPSLLRPVHVIALIFVLLLVSVWAYAASENTRGSGAQISTRIAQKTIRADYPRLEDVSTLDGIMKAYYEVVSGPAHTPRNIERDLSLHHPKAQMMVPDKDENGQPIVRAMTVKAFHDWGASVYEPGFYESETQREVLSFGRSTHVWSTYATRRTPDGEVIARGINSIQLYFDGQRYWILSETWDSERKDNPLTTKEKR